MNVTRYEPFGDLFDDLFRGFLVRPVYGEQGQQAQAGAPMRLRVDVKEHDGAYTVVADVPGVKKEDIQVTVDGDVLTIQAESRGESEKKEGERVVFSERHYGRYARSFRLGGEIDLARAEAKYENGVLNLRLPKKAAEAARKLTIS